MKLNQQSFFLLALIFLQGLLGTQVNAGEKPEVIFETSMGSFTLELYPDKAPKTVANFLAYVDDGFYDNTIFHRVIPDFVVQGGGFEAGMKYKEPHAPVKNESSNRLKNITGTISMARRSHPDTATSQFYINLSHNSSLDYISDYQPGYTVFGKISKGMDVIDKISAVETETVDRSKDVPKDDVVLLSVKRKASADLVKAPAGSVKHDKNPDAPGQKVAATEKKQNSFVAGEHYVVLDRPVPTRDNSKIEVVEMFTYGCPHCYEFEPLVKAWGKQQASDVDFWVFPAVWSRPMKLYARAFYVANELNVSEKIHIPLFNAIAIEQKSIRNEGDLADFFENHGVDRKDFTEAFNSTETETQVEHAEERVRLYNPVGAPEIIVNGKYRIERMRAGGLAEMLAVVDYLVNKERATLEN
jgi:cyclophilin family peptidyl-prolyl cis-trans isomerase